MPRRAASSRIVLLSATACFVFFAVVAGGHLHQLGAAGTLTSECQLCSVGQARIDLSAIVPALYGLVLLSAFVALAPAAVPSRRSLILPALRAPPLR
jgi:hypothetical protein